MKKYKYRIVALFVFFFVVMITPSCEALLEALSTPTTQNDDNKTTPDNTDNTSKGKTQKP